MKSIHYCSLKLDPTDTSPLQSALTSLKSGGQIGIAFTNPVICEQILDSISSPPLADVIFSKNLGIMVYLLDRAAIEFSICRKYIDSPGDPSIAFSIYICSFACESLTDAPPDYFCPAGLATLQRILRRSDLIIIDNQFYEQRHIQGDKPPGNIWIHFSVEGMNRCHHKLEPIRLAAGLSSWEPVPVYLHLFTEKTGEFSAEKFTPTDLNRTETRQLKEYLDTAVSNNVNFLFTSDRIPPNFLSGSIRWQQYTEDNYDIFAEFMFSGCDRNGFRELHGGSE